MLRLDPAQPHDHHIFWEINEGDVWRSDRVRGGSDPATITAVFGEGPVELDDPEVTVRLLPDADFDSTFACVGRLGVKHESDHARDDGSP